MMDERERIEQAIAAQESLRATVGDEVVDETIAMLRRELAHLETPEQQRKLVTILYADIVGSTEIVKHLDPEDALEIMDGSLKRLAIPVEEHGGHIARYMGDGFKAVFGMPKAHENDPEMATRAGLGILQAAQELGPELDTQWGISDFQVRVGINTGLAALGGMTEAEDTVMGSTVNLTKRVESAAPSGGLLITHNTYRHVRGIFTVREHEPIQAKGFDQPVIVYRVLGVKPRAFRVQTRGVEGVETHMVGRKVELIALQEAYRNAIEGRQTRVVTVVGEAGVGKSRLLYEFDNWIELIPDELYFFQGRGRQETQNLTYALLKDVFTFRFQIQESDKSSELRKKIEAGFGEVLGMDEEGQMRAHITGQLLGFDFSTSQHLKGILDDPQQIHDRALMYLAEYFQGMSEGAPVVIFLEDIHWADDSSLDILNRLARRIPEQRLLVVCAARHRLYERRPYWGEGLAYHRRMELQPLTRYDSSQLVTEILQKVDQIPDSIQDLVVKGAEGNPFYIEELIKMLIEDGIIITGEEKWQVEPERLAEVDVPDTLTGVLQARLEGLPQEERNTLQQASVVGYIFWDATVEYITNESLSAVTKSSQHFIDENLSSLRARELVYHREESAFTDAAEYTFKHALLRDVTYESVLRRVRKAYHGLVAEWLIKHSEERAGEYTGLIADHLELAGKQEQAAIYLYQAGEEAAKRYANDEAVKFFSRALAMTSEDDLAGRYDLLMAREKVLEIKGAREAQQADLAALEKLAEVLEDQSKQGQVALRRIIYLEMTGDFQAVSELAKNTIDLAMASGDLEIEAYIRLHWGRSLWREGKNEAAQPLLEFALELACERQLFQIEADSLRSLGGVAEARGDIERAISYAAQALEKYRKIGDKRGEAAALNNLGSGYEFKYDYKRAREYYDQALQISQEIGDRWGEGFMYGSLGYLAGCLYEYDKVFDWLPQSLAISKEIGDRFGEYRNSLHLGWVYFYTGEYGKVEIYFTSCLDIALQSGDLDGEINARARLARYYSSLGDFSRANTYFDNLLEAKYEFKDPFIKANADLHYGWFTHYVVNAKAVQEYCRECTNLFVERNVLDLEWERLMLSGYASTTLGKLTQAEDFYQQAISLSHEMRRERHALEAQAGLAQVYMARGETEQALTQVNEILAYMEANTPPKGSSFCLDGTEEPFRILLTCYHALKANDDPRADATLEDAYNLLQTRAAKISDEHLRDCFLNNVAVNWEIVSEYEGLTLERGASL
jgi:class 3 adenylate cyclase/tetratricopeptide (TPR) repeat protein